MRTVAPVVALKPHRSAKHAAKIVLPQRRFVDAIAVRKPVIGCQGIVAKIVEH